LVFLQPGQIPNASTKTTGTVTTVTIILSIFMRFKIKKNPAFGYFLQHNIIQYGKYVTVMIDFAYLFI
jgi:hypothetical protein